MTTSIVKPKKKPSVASIVGAPAQHNQSSRKGKKAWRKNVNIEDLEEKLEGLREEERTFGSTLRKKTDSELYIVDTKGDDKGIIRKSLPHFDRTSLKSHQIITQRSAVTAVYARPRRSLMSAREKERLLRIARRDRRGPLNSIVDPSQPGAGSALLEASEAVKKSGKYDMWSVEVEEGLDGGVKVKAPAIPHPRTMITLPAVPAPHVGTSYNPPEVAHSALLRTAYETELRRVKEAEAFEATKARIFNKLDAGEGQDDSEHGDIVRTGSVSQTKKTLPKRKTKQQRLKAEKLRAEKYALVERILRKRLHASVDSVKSLRKAADRTLAARAQASAERRSKQEACLAQNGLAGQKLGKHIVREVNVDVQLGEELSESLRGLRPEGNLFRDRLWSMQQRALIEPRVPILPKKRKQMVEYEKHAWKRFA
ncbi:tumor suppressor protein Gltscr2 [Multifurca ochricompacta]|uniref:Ribosome biogenesis protein NOP53 n=1 Tax=Multifurca ochricompacta TaxID=376703 RepID=A0AAD4M324_9AGAM|nr:tumor suppressor protein Gltscr2 [Multifurca ochricompacta]